MKMANPTLGIGIYLLLFFALLGVVGLEGCATVSQSEACKKYVACLSARDAKLGVSTDVKRFENGGACWGGPEGADLCTRACSSGLSWLQKSYTSLPSACN